MMSITATHAHSEIRKAASPNPGDAGVVITTPTAAPNVNKPIQTAPARTVNADGTPYKPQVSATINKPAPTVTSGSGPYLANIDRSRTPAKAPASTQNGNFASVNRMPVTDLTGIGGLRQNEVELLAGYGINVGITAGVLTLERKYAPSARGIILQARGV